MRLGDSEKAPVAGCCQHCHETSGCIKPVEFIVQLSNSQPLMGLLLQVSRIKDLYHYLR
jgi:hypothetical protein